MKIMKLKRMTLDGEPLYVDVDNECCEDPDDYWCVIETEEEQIVHDLAIENGGEHMRIWNFMINHAGIPYGLSWGDDDIYAYITSDEMEPEVGEEWTDGDGDKWLRVE